ncbi:MAG: hypothetical protein K1X83_14960 [Oligoflexia bacterium]|nr:hypothetical protein [Oligoflexia bacterium]
MSSVEAFSSVSSGVPFFGTAVVDEIIQSDRGYARGPERALMSALLFDGVQAYLNFVSATPFREIKRQQEAYNWIHKRGTEYIFSFDSVCEALGIDPDYLRLGLINAVRSRGSRKKARRTF